MAAKSLNQQIFRLTGGLVLLSAIAILVNVWFSTVEHAEKQLRGNLQIAESVFKQTFSNREEQLYNSVDILTSDFGFKAAVASDDEATIESALLNHGQRVEADLMAQLSLQGTVISTTNPSLEVGGQFPYQTLIEQTNQRGGANTIMMLNDQLYQAILLVVETPRPHGITLIGFDVDNTLLERLKSITQLDVTISVEQQGNVTYSVSTLQAAIQEQALQLTTADLSWLDVLLFSDALYISKRFLYVDNGDNQIWVTLSENVTRLYGEFNRLQLKITAIAAILLILTLMFGAMFAKKLSTPLYGLSRYARRISGGDYEQVIEVDSKTTEIDALSTAFVAMQANIKERQSEIEFQATHDLLTGIYNRYKIAKILDARFKQDRQFVVVGANIHGFRGVNDIFGYQSGDRCLQAIAARFEQLDGECARLSGGEFLWLPDREINDEVLSIVQRKIEMPIIVDDVVMNIKIALGVLQCPQDCSDSESVFKRVNICLDEARVTQGLIVSYAEEFERNYVRRLAIISELKKALVTQQSELSLCYQPKLNLNTNKVDHAEALIRWNSSQLGFVPPDEFIAIAEQAGLINQVTQWVINAVIDDVVTLREHDVRLSIAINLSAKDIVDPHLLSNVTDKLKEFDLPHDCLSFEITESDIVSDPKKAVAELQRFRDAGFSLAIDDFGTGYSSLTYLKSLPVTELKIDKSFVLKLNTQRSDQQIVQTILHLAKSFNLDVVAEGVEDKASLTLLREWGCKWGQGYYICKPAPLSQLISWYTDNLATDWTT
ncbi:putative bifunctional diguanylate cyclase/phosphodiesterase [Alteromonas ponticola]|uniref:EAL domain-containing protein n=1 Tax=Alteromonas ponticola TaxID=2720613 RepID=A0ABX1R0C1_9ALTE|nr:bifunctional diguanylate cyclase/phosphodiesterase [Alteromonas ponticola]NMH59912.1 EAL domain-containing protein [Alteromonas ponticola]